VSERATPWVAIPFLWTTWRGPTHTARGPRKGHFSTSQRRVAVRADRATVAEWERGRKELEPRGRRVFTLPEDAFAIVPDRFTEHEGLVVEGYLPDTRYHGFEVELGMDAEGALQAKAYRQGVTERRAARSIQLNPAALGILVLYWAETPEAAMDALVRVGDAAPEVVGDILTDGAVELDGQPAGEAHRLPPFTPEQYARLLEHPAREVREAAQAHARTALAGGRLAVGSGHVR
jgi:hypothetical protein